MAKTVSINLATLSGFDNVSAGTHTLKLKAKAQNIISSDLSAGVSYTKPSYLAFKNVSDIAGNFSASITSSSISPNLEYSFDQITWTTYTPKVSDLDYVSVEPNRTIYLRGTNPNGISTSSDQLILNFDQYCEISGHIMTLISPNDDVLTIPNSYCFYKLYQGICAIRMNRDNLNAVGLKQNCYWSLFSSNTASFVDDIELDMPITATEASCCQDMFRGISTNVIVNLPNLININGTDALSFIQQTGQLTLNFSKNLSSIGNGTYYGWTYFPTVVNLRLPFDDNDTINFDVSNVVGSAGVKSSYVANVYTDNTSIANAVVLKRNEYTTVNVYHLDGTSWELQKLDAPYIALNNSTLNILSVLHAEQYEIYKKEGSSGSYTLRMTTSSTSVNISSLISTSGSIKVRAIATGYLASEFSNEITV